MRLIDYFCEYWRSVGGTPNGFVLAPERVTWRRLEGDEGNTLRTSLCHVVDDLDEFDIVIMLFHELINVLRQTLRRQTGYFDLNFGPVAPGEIGQEDGSLVVIVDCSVASCSIPVGTS